MSQTINEAAAEFMGEKRVAVTGVSRNPQGHGSKVVRLRQGSSLWRRTRSDLGFARSGFPRGHVCSMFARELVLVCTDRARGRGDAAGRGVSFR
jgi:hypothetical protein